ncbi:SDR family oxidoreductase [Mariniblastus fucicola]|uniref:SDR family oxidoreductase n=1 Tax=Mariniblastus fucicola TaxID=980251 RepID=UPI0009466DFA|nr:SDR family oxidoreductase [Mariniblastus fucicola]
MKRLVIGCGFLGLPLAKFWQSSGDSVHVTTRSEQRAADFFAAGLLPLVLDTTKPTTVQQLESMEFDTVVSAVGMDRSQYKSVHDVYVGGMQNVLNHLNENTGQLVYVSSTGVYGDFDGAWVDESSPTDPQRDGGKACLAAEELLKASRFADRTTILRMAGLYGNERIPTKSAVASKQWSKLSATGFLNLIHVDDAVQAICVVSDRRNFAETYLVADSNPTLRREYYQYLADQFELGPIPWSDARPDPNSRGSSSKRISNRKLLEQTGLVLKHPDFRSGLAGT